MPAGALAIDRLDFRILAALHKDALLSNAAIARDVALTAPAVRERLRRLDMDGILVGYWTHVEPSVFGRGSDLLSFKGPFDRRQAEWALRQSDVVWVSWKLDGDLTVQLYPKAKSDAAGDLRAGLGKPARRFGPNWPDPVELPELQRRVLAAMVQQPRLDRAGLVDATGLSPKTAVKHRGALLKAGHAAILPRIGVLKGGGVAAFHLAVIGKPNRQALRRAIGDCVTINDEPNVVYLLCRADDLQDALTRLEQVRRLPGVKEAHITANRAHLVNADRMAAWLAT